MPGDGYRVAIKLQLVRLDLSNRIFSVMLEDDFLEVYIPEVRTNRSGSWKSLWACEEFVCLLETIQRAPADLKEFQLIVQRMYQGAFNPLARAVFLDGKKVNSHARKVGCSRS